MYDCRDCSVELANVDGSTILNTQTYIDDYKQMLASVPELEETLAVQYSEERGRFLAAARGFDESGIVFLEESVLIRWCNIDHVGNERMMDAHPNLPWAEWLQWQKSVHRKKSCVGAIALASCLAFVAEKSDFEDGMRPFERLCGCAGDSNDHISELADILSKSRHVAPFSQLPNVCFSSLFLQRLAARLEQNAVAYATNGSGVPVYGVFVLFSLLNHDCQPNVEVVAAESGTEISLQARCKIRPGDALTINYLLSSDVDAEKLTLAERQGALGHWGFQCSCRKCENETASTTRETKRLKRDF